ncbi:MAG TPA: peptidoglycan-binding domain-containing protein [Candidatus Paceibacterota bacterium]
MDNFKFLLFSVLVLALFGFSGYWAFSTIETGSSHVDIQKQKELAQNNEDLTKEVTQLKKEISLLQLDKEAQAQKEKDILDVKTTQPVVVATTPTKTVVLKYQSLINDLQKLVNNNILLKNKSQGPAVGTVQKFLNIYNSTSNKIDNDYGLSTVNAIKNFQKAEGLTVDGGSGSSVFKKMISWLKSQ